MRSTNMTDDSLVPETYRRVGSLILMWGGWGYATFIFTWGILEFNPSKGQFAPQWVGFSFTASLVLAIAGTLVRSRMRLQDTITQTLQIGMEASRLAHQEVMSTVKEGNGNSHGPDVH